MIEIGQDLLGGWAWILYDRTDRMVTSGEGLPDRALARQVALAVYRGLVNRREANLWSDPVVCYPDEDEAWLRQQASNMRERRRE
jgi:hypothetical protein